MRTLILSCFFVLTLTSIYCERTQLFPGDEISLKTRAEKQTTKKFSSIDHTRPPHSWIVKINKEELSKTKSSRSLRQNDEEIISNLAEEFGLELDFITSKVDQGYATISVKGIDFGNSYEEDDNSENEKRRVEGEIIHNHGSARRQKMSRSEIDAENERIETLLRSSPLIKEVQREYYKFNLSRFTPSDPGWVNQWHLRDSGGSRWGANVQQAWDYADGTGIRIMIVDDGVDSSHSDFPRYDSACSRNYNAGQSTSDGTPGSASDDHGTPCAGVAAADDDTVCGVGAAYRSTIGSQRINGGSVTTSQEATALQYCSSTFDIYSNSWGPPDDGETYPVSSVITSAFNTGVTSGRGGLGSIFVWAAGNGRNDQDNSNLDGYANAPETIAVAALGSNGEYASYSEPGSNILVTAPSSSSFTSDSIYTSGYDGSTSNYCDTSFGGTSSSCPLVAGIIGLMLERNPNLTWRDVQHLLVYNTEICDPTDGAWLTNAAGLQYNWAYGFGSVNAINLVYFAKHWATVGPRYLIDSGDQVLSSNNDIPEETPVNWLSDAVVMTGNSGRRIEHVIVQVDITHDYDRDIELDLLSPSGTFSKLVHADTPAGFGTTGGYTFSSEFMSVHFWGETSTGSWTLFASDQVSGLTGTLNKWRLKIYETDNMSQFGHRNTIENSVASCDSDPCSSTGVCGVCVPDGGGTSYTCDSLAQDTCDSPPSGDLECYTTSCDNSGGPPSCIYTPVLDGTACTSDNLFCTGTETCQSGACVGSGDPCTGSDTCNETSDTCDPPTDPCEGVVCDNSPDPCRTDVGTCSGGTCSYPNFVVDGTTCPTDNLFCTGPESCQSGACVGSGDPCTGGDTCNETSDTCDTPDPCEGVSCTLNGVFCDGEETCVDGSCVSPGDPCTSSQTCNEDTNSCDERIVETTSSDQESTESSGNSDSAPATPIGAIAFAVGGGVVGAVVIGGIFATRGSSKDDVVESEIGAGKGKSGGSGDSGSPGSPSEGKALLSPSPAVSPAVPPAIPKDSPPSYGETAKAFAANDPPAKSSNEVAHVNTKKSSNATLAPANQTARRKKSGSKRKSPNRGRSKSPGGTAGGKSPNKRRPSKSPGRKPSGSAASGGGIGATSGGIGASTTGRKVSAAQRRSPRRTGSSPGRKVSFTNKETGSKHTPGANSAALVANTVTTTTRSPNRRRPSRSPNGRKTSRSPNGGRVQLKPPTGSNPGVTLQ